MQLHELKPLHKAKKKKRIGRGGKRGSFSGHGIKGQKSRAGAKIRPAERDLIIRLPKLRGFKNRPLVEKTRVVNVGDLKKTNGGLITEDTLVKAGLIKKGGGCVKILGSGEIDRPLKLKIKGVKVSKSAELKIKAAKGEILS